MLPQRTVEFLDLMSHSTSLEFQLLMGEVPVVAAVAAVAEELEVPEGYDMPIEQLQLSVRAYNCLKRSSLMTVGAVLEKSEEELLALRNFGEKSYMELRDKLVNSGFPAPRIVSRHDGAMDAAAVETAMEAPTATAAAEPEADDEEVGALGAALMEALKEAERESD